MFLSKSSRLQKFLVGAFMLIFAWLALTCIHTTYSLDHSFASMSCDISAGMSHVTCTQGSSLVLLFTVLVGVGVGIGFALRASNYPSRLTSTANVVHLIPVAWIKRPAFSPLLEMFRKGIMHPKLYSF